MPFAVVCPMIEDWGSIPHEVAEVRLVEGLAVDACLLLLSRSCPPDSETSLRHAKSDVSVLLEARMKSVEKTGFATALRAKRHDIGFLTDG